MLLKGVKNNVYLYNVYVKEVKLTKPNYIYFYKSDNAVDDILKHSPFHYDEPIKIRKSKNEALFEYEHFDLRCYRMRNPNQNVRGYRTWQVLVEDTLYDEMDREFLNCYLYPMMSPYHNLGGRIVKIEKYNA